MVKETIDVRRIAEIFGTSIQNIHKTYIRTKRLPSFKDKDAEYIHSPVLVEVSAFNSLLRSLIKESKDRAHKLEASIIEEK